MSESSYVSSAAGPDDVDDVTGEKEPSVQQKLTKYECSLIDPNQVFYALKEFVMTHAKVTRKERNKPQFRLENISERDATHDTDFWRQYQTAVLGQKREHVWDALLGALDQHNASNSEELNIRCNLISETDALKQQNAELRMLLQQYITSKVNQDLEIPPTRTLQMDVPRQ